MKTRVGHRRELFNSIAPLREKINIIRKILADYSLEGTINEEIRDMYNAEIWLKEQTLVLIEETLISGKMKNY